MNRDLEIWQFAARKLARGEPLTLLVAAESAGSSPGRQGFKMIVAREEMRGSIGGGVMEMRLAEAAQRKMENGKWKINAENPKSEIQNPKSKIVEQVHRKNSRNPSGMICSGKQTIIFLSLDLSDLKTVRQIIGALKNRQSKILRISNSEFRIAENTSEDETQNENFKFTRSGANEFLYEENLGFKNKLSIVGGGHCALALSELMSKMDFHISLFDDRAGLNTIKKNKFADAKTIVKSYETIDEFIPPGANSYVVVMTLGYKSDEIVVRKLLDKNFKYFGVLGSRAKMATLLKNLRAAGFDAEKLNRLRAPIGLPINSRTPAEIAVSIAAEIIAVKNSV